MYLALYHPKDSVIFDHPYNRLGASGRLVAAVHASAPITQFGAAYLNVDWFRLCCLTEPRCPGPQVSESRLGRSDGVLGVRFRIS